MTGSVEATRNYSSTKHFGRSSVVRRRIMSCRNGNECSITPVEETGQPLFDNCFRRYNGANLPLLDLCDDGAEVGEGLEGLEVGLRRVRVGVAKTGLDRLLDTVYARGLITSPLFIAVTAL